MNGIVDRVDYERFIEKWRECIIDEKDKIEKGVVHDGDLLN